ncbi:MAG TPA: adenylate/guanylate cyclase domain-containing protein [Acidimicrobiales bacterium]|nr:adenylate/guanylate cyclase domain-containing protein [Acidimicrobiales bacterium]
MLAPPLIQFAERNGTHLAYQSAGSGPDMLFVAGSLSTSLCWEDPKVARAFRRMASFTHFVTYDQRGMGYSDPIDANEVPVVGDLVEDLAAVIEAAGLSDPVLFAYNDGGAVAVAYAAARPVRSLVLCNTWARMEVDDDYPIGIPSQILDRMEERYRSEWGQGGVIGEFGTSPESSSHRRTELASTSRNQAVRLFQWNRRLDIRALLPLVEAPTLVIHLKNNRSVPPALGLYVAEHIPGARWELVPGVDHMFLSRNADPVVDQVEQFVTGTLRPFADRLEPTMLFTDIVGSTARAASLGDRGWSALIDEHNQRVRQQINIFGGHESKCTGDGFLVVFDGAAPAIRCAAGAMEAVRRLGLELRAGVHLGEVYRMGASDLAGLDVHLAQRLCAAAASGQVVVSGAVRRSCDDPSIGFRSLGVSTFKGIPGETEVFAAEVGSGWPIA